jgi:hypothetical protein
VAMPCSSESFRMVLLYRSALVPRINLLMAIKAR